MIATAPRLVKLQREPLATSALGGRPEVPLTAVAGEPCRRRRAPRAEPH